LLYNSSTLKRKIVTIGGGTGTALVNEALLLTHKVDFIDSVVTPFDNGGETQRRRLDSYGQEIAYSDAIRILVSLIDPKTKDDPNVQVINRWLLHRDSRDKVLGREIVNTFFDKASGFSQIEKDLADLGVRLNGQVLPSSTKFSHIVFTTVSGLKYKGENLLDEHKTSRDIVKKIELQPKVNAYKPTLEAIKNADIIFLSCGSLYGSLLCNFLPIGMKAGMNLTKAKIYLITNLFTSRNETHGMTPIKLARLVKEYTGRNITGLIVPKMTRVEFEKQYPKTAYLYQVRESSYFLGWDEAELDKAREAKFEVITHEALKIIEFPDENTIIVRHDPEKLAKILTSIL
jgi:uncharacterized cofD-like protein